MIKLDFNHFHSLSANEYLVERAQLEQVATATLDEQIEQHAQALFNRPVDLPQPQSKVFVSLFGDALISYRSRDYARSVRSLSKALSSVTTPEQKKSALNTLLLLADKYRESPIYSQPQPRLCDQVRKKNFNRQLTPPATPPNKENPAPSETDFLVEAMSYFQLSPTPSKSHSAALYETLYHGDFKHTFFLSEFASLAQTSRFVEAGPIATAYQFLACLYPLEYPSFTLPCVEKWAQQEDDSALRNFLSLKRKAGEVSPEPLEPEEQEKRYLAAKALYMLFNQGSLKRLAADDEVSEEELDGINKLTFSNRSVSIFLPEPLNAYETSSMLLSNWILYREELIKLVASLDPGLYKPKNKELLLALHEGQQVLNAYEGNYDLVFKLEGLVPAIQEMFGAELNKSAAEIDENESLTEADRDVAHEMMDKLQGILGLF